MGPACVQCAPCNMHGQAPRLCSSSEACGEQAITCACACDCNFRDHIEFVAEDEEDAVWQRCSCISCGPLTAQGARRCRVRLCPVVMFFQHSVVRGKQPPTDPEDLPLTFCGNCEDENLLALKQVAVVRARNRRKFLESFTRRERSRSRDKGSTPAGSR